MTNKKNKMTISCEVDEEINFKALCDTLAGDKIPSTINGKHSKTLVKLMKIYYKNNYKNLTTEQKICLENFKSIYKQNKIKSGFL